MKSNNSPEKTTDNLIKNGWLTDKAWLTGLIAIAAVLLVAFWYKTTGAFNTGVSIGGWRITNAAIDTVLFALVTIILMVAIFEAIRVYCFDKKNYFSVDANLKQKKYMYFLSNCIIKYLESLTLLFLIILFFKTAGEYGFKNNARFYQPWFRLLDFAWTAYLWAGLPYLIITRALHSNTDQDLKSFSFICKRLGGNPVEQAPLFIRNCILRMFFAPLTCVFFAEHFPALVNSFEYISTGLSASVQNGVYRHDMFNRDLIKIALSLLLSIHMAIACCGYICISPWLKNTINSSDPSFVGWIVCLLSYPPFTLAITWYFAPPGDRDFMSLHSDTFVSVLGVVLVLTYALYISATVSFGTRFSNLTNRGIIRTGLYRWVRHPAYAAYVFGLWITALPFIVAQLDTKGFGFAMGLLLGLFFNTWVYYMRAITEEKHLSNDADYQEYCRVTPRRFVPRLL